MLFKPLFYTVIFSLLLSFNAVAQKSEAAENPISTTNKLISPSYLKPGDLVAIVAPSGILKNRDREVNQAKELLESWGLKVTIGQHVFSKDNHFAGTDQQRAEDFQKALDDPNVKAIWCARGGYGTVRVLDLLDYTKFRQNPKWLIGYSDITALHNDIHNLGVETIHALMCTSLTEDLTEIEQSVETFKCAIFGNDLGYTVAANPKNKPGKATGQLVGAGSQPPVADALSL